MRKSNFLISPLFSRTTSKLLRISEIKSDIAVFPPRHLMLSVSCLPEGKGVFFFNFCASLLYFLQVSSEEIIFALQKKNDLNM